MPALTLGFGFFLETSSQGPKEFGTASLGELTQSEEEGSDELGEGEELGTWVEWLPCSWLTFLVDSLMV